MEFIEDGVYGTDLRPRYYLKNDTIKITETSIDIGEPSPESLKRWAEFERKTILLREKNFNEGCNFYENLQNLDIGLIGDLPSGWNLFDKPKEHELVDLMRSIRTVGLIYPIYVLLHSSGSYSVICGKCRLVAYINLFRSTGELKYKHIPAYVINEDDVDELFIRTMIIESNLRYRTISKSNMIQSVITTYEIMKKAKIYRNEKNVGTELSELFEISESTVFNFVKVRHLCDQALTLLYEDRISLKAALYLTKVSKETQVNILERFGIKGVNAIFKLKLITSEGDISVEKLNERIDSLKKFTPPTTKITIELRREFVNKLLECLMEFKDSDIQPFANFYTKGNTSTVFKVRCDKEAMDYYIKENVIDENIYKRLISKKIG